MPLAEVEEDGPEEEDAKETSPIVLNSSCLRPIVAEETTANVSSNLPLRPVAVSARTHKDSGREVPELEPIDEHGERLESASLESTSLDESK